jgi:ABC-type glycerol-3-phosphate transport system substrate-binding protein
MKRFYTKVLALVMSVLLLLCSTASIGCKKPDSEIWIDPNRTQLYVGLKENGIGREWLDEIVKEYEKIRTDVQVIVEPKNTEFDTDQLKATISYNRQDMYFVAMIDYYNFINADGTSDLLYDMTDAVTAENGTEGSIWDKMREGDKNFFNVGTEESKKIYGIPYTSSYWGLIYDKDFFRGMGLYDLDGYIGIDGVEGTEDDFFGPDGMEGTFDDGLPPTWEDMKLLMDVMVGKGITPFTWTGQYYTYRTQWLNSVIASYEGVEDFNIRYSFDGVDSHANVGEINSSNAYKLIEQDGLKAALTVAKHIASNPNYYSNKVTNLSQSHKQAQLEFVKSVKSGKPIGFLIDGEWWLRESYDANFATIDDMHSRRFGILPLPRATRAEVGTPVTNVCDHYSSIFINSNCPANKVAAAKELFSFLQNESSLLTFSYYTNMVRSLDYELSDERLAEMGYFSSDPKYASTGREFGYFTKNIYNTRLADPTTTLTPWQPTSDTTRLMTTLLAYRKWGFSAVIDNTPFENPLICLRANESLTEEEYFLAIYKYWDNYFSKK